MKRFLPDFLKPYAGRILLTIIGLVIAILFLTIGFWPTILIVVLMVAGFLIGSWLDGTLRLDSLPFFNRRNR